MNAERFGNSPSGRVLRAGPPERPYFAFVPNPLPPLLPYDAKLVMAVSEAAYALGELAALGRSMANPHLLISPFIRREAVLSSRIEGTQASLADLYAYEAGQLPLPGLEQGASEDDVREVANYVEALKYGLERLNTLPMSLRLLRELHERLLAGVRGEHATPGEFRKSQNWIGRPGCTLAEADFVPPPVPEMADALFAFEKYLHSDDRANPPLVQLALLHYQFEAIHPFLDGNGRIGRLLITLLLMSWGLLPSPLLYLSAYFEQQRDRYYDLLLQVSERGAWRDWVLFFLQGIAEQSRDAGTRAKQLQDLRDEWRDRLSKQRNPASLLALVDSLFATPVLTIPGVSKALGIAYNSAQANVAKLVGAGILKQLGQSSYGKTYAAWEILQVVLHQH
jgi:Fic family protein